MQVRFIIHNSHPTGDKKGIGVHRFVPKSLPGYVLCVSLVIASACVSSSAQVREYLVCSGDTFIYPAKYDSATYHINFGDGKVDSGNNQIKHLFAQSGKYNVLAARTVNTKTDTMKYIVNVGSLPKPAFETSPACYLYHFTNQIPDTVMVSGGWEWNFGDGVLSFDGSPSHLYQKEAGYKVSLGYARKNQCNSSITKPISVSASFYPGFDYHVNNDDAIFLPLDTSQAYYHWDFGDKDTTDSLTPVHIFTSTGEYPVSLTMRSAGGCETVYTDTISVTSAGVQPVIANANLFNAFPNPFKNELVIHYEIIGSKNVAIELYDGTGRLVANIGHGLQHTGRYDIYINPVEYRLRAGLYLIKAYFDQEYLSQKLVME